MKSKRYLILIYLSAAATFLFSCKDNTQSSKVNVPVQIQKEVTVAFGGNSDTLVSVDTLFIYSQADMCILETENISERKITSDCTFEFLSGCTNNNLKNYDEASEIEYSIKTKEINGITISAICCFDNFFSVNKKNEICINQSELDNVLDNIAKLADISDYVIVCAVYSDTADSMPTTRQSFFAHQLINSGADIVIGYSDSGIMPIENYNDGIIFYNAVPLCNNERTLAYRTVIDDTGFLKAYVYETQWSNKLQKQVISIEENSENIKTMSEKSKDYNISITSWGVIQLPDKNIQLNL